MKICFGIYEMKDKTIRNLISHLSNKIDFERLQIIDYWEADNCAVGFINEIKDKLIYVSSFQKELNHFYVELEFINDLKENEIFENLTTEKIEELLMNLI